MDTAGSIAVLHADASSALDGNSSTFGVQQLISQYVGQLRQGCESLECKEGFCHTGRLNTSYIPVRRYTPRSATAIAMGLVSGPAPRAHLCRYFSKSKPAANATVDDASPRDPSSMMQLVCDTDSVRQLSNPSTISILDPELQELAQMHEQLDRVLLTGGRMSSTSEGAAARDANLASDLSPILSWLLSKLPLQRSASWVFVNREFIGRGQAYPQRVDRIPTDGRYNTWLQILDILSHEPYLRLLARVFQGIAHRIVVCRRLATMRFGKTRQNTAQQSDESKLHASIRIELQLGAIDVARTLALIVWLKRLFAKHWDGNPTIKYGTVCHGVLGFMTYLRDHNTTLQPAPFEREIFMIPFVPSTIGMVEFCQSFRHWQSEECSDGDLHLLVCSWIFSPEQIMRYFRTSNHLAMREAHAQVEKALMLWRRTEAMIPSIHAPRQPQFLHAEQHYLLLNVSRDDILKDTFDQLWQRRKGELRRPLRVRLGETNELEIGHDLGGVQIEFFNLVCRKLFSGEAQMFTTDSITGNSYFRPGSLQPLYMFELFGVLLALALYNGIALPMNMPLIFYKLLLAPHSHFPLMSPRLDDLVDGWPTLARSLRETSRRDIPGLEFSFPIEANGLRLTVLNMSHQSCVESSVNTSPPTIEAVDAMSISDGKAVTIAGIEQAWPGWRILPTERVAPDVTSENRTDYVASYVRHTVLMSVAPQWCAFRKGFHDSKIFDHGSLFPLSPQDLKNFIEGTDHLDVHELKAATRYDGFDPRSKYMNLFWKIVMAWPQEKQKELLKFVTATERIPISGTSNLTFVIKRSTPSNLESLPTSSTCFGTLMLPRYPNAEILAAKLSLALKYGTEGFGTG